MLPSRRTAVADAGRLPFRYARECPPVARRDRLGASQAPAALVAQRGEERAVRRLRAVAHHARERMQEDDGATERERRRVAPEAEHVSEARGRQR